ncbi:MAG: hypothetical protein HC923_09605 [Myxococcales bacterium]|nr:hypothetical protein [Myxococcales bacterium]
MHDDLPFQRITFKQVGSHRSDIDAHLLFEVLAEAVAMDLHEVSGWRAHSSFVPEIADPSAHLACSAAHVYVDFWETASPETGWGFSLWSGCTESDRFALGAVVSSSEDLVQWVKPLSEEIAGTLRDAQIRSCWTRSC